MLAQFELWSEWFLCLWMFLEEDIAPLGKWIFLMIGIYLIWKIIRAFPFWREKFGWGSKQCQITCVRKQERSVRYLLCDNANCKICEKAAKEATDLIYREKQPSQVCSDGSRRCFSTASYRGSPRLPRILEEDGQDSFQRRISEPAPCTAQIFEGLDWPNPTRAPPASSRTPDDSDIFLQSGQSQWERETLLLEKMMYSLGSLQEALRGNVRQRTSLTQEEDQTSVAQRPISFLDEATVTKLESHLTAKRMQHLMGLPSTLLSSIRSFMPPAPPLPPQKSHCEIQVVPRLPALSFLPASTKKNLEHHLKKRIQQKHWNLPQRIQKALICLKPPFPSKQETFHQGYKSRGVVKNLQGTSSGSLPTTTEVLNIKTTPESQAKLQAHFLKKCLEMRLQSFPAMVEYSKKVTGGKGRNSHLPKLIPPGCVSLQTRNSSCLNLLEKSDVVEMNIKCKLCHYQWNLPTVYMQSMMMFCTSPLALPITHSQIPDFSKCDHVAPTFLPLQDRKLLETHVLRKRLQHQWEMPGLVQYSLGKFLLPAPSSPANRGAKFQGQQIITVANPLPFVSSETKQNLEKHLRSIIVQRQWGIPKRVFDSLQAFLPPPPPSYTRSKVNQDTFALPLVEEMKKRSTVEERSCQKPAGYSRKTQGMAAQDTQHLCLSQSETKILLQRFLLKKRLEILLGSLPLAVRASWNCSLFYGREPLPKMILPGAKSLLPRRSLLPFACKKDVDRIEMAIKRNHLASLWELGTHYVGAIQGMTSKPLSQPFQPRETASPCFDTPVKLLSDVDRERLEHHVLKKKIDHEWGLPILFQKSLQSFVGEPTSLSFKKMGKVSVDVQVRELSFLPKNIQTHLEHHIQKMKLHHLWEMPRRVLESTRMLHPEFKTGKFRPTTSLDEKSIAKKAGQLRPSAVCALKKGEVIPFHGSQRFPMVEAKSLDRIGLHLSKKSLEIHLDVFPKIFKLSWKRDSISFKQPLPKLINPSVRPLRPRTVSLSLGPQEISKIDLSLRRNHMACLWGLGTRYVEVLGRVAPRLPFHLVKRSACEFSEVSTPFLTGTDRENLEQHIQKKRFQHLWGYPALVQESIQGFMPKTPTLSRLSKAMTEVQVLRQELSFLPQGITAHLEFHIQRIKLQRRWAMPGRVLKSQKLFLQSHPMGRELPSTYKEKAEVSTKVAQQSYQRGVHTIFTAHNKTKNLDNHLERKCHQINFQAFPSPLTHSQEDVSSREGKLLPKLIHVGQKSPTCRKTSMFFLPPAVRDIVELNVKQKDLTFLWGLPQKHMVSHTKYYSIHIKQRNIQFQCQETPFLQKEGREQLEHHVKQKRLHHFWGMPSTIQKSLNCFIHPPPVVAPYPKGRRQEVRIQRKALSFVPDHIQEKLETSLKKMMIRRQWGLPEKFHQSLRSFLPSLTKNKELHGEESMVESKLMYGPEVKRAKHIIGSQQRIHRDSPHKKSPDTSVKPFHKARSPKQSSPDGIQFCTCYQSSRGHVQSNVEASHHSATISRHSQRRGLVEKDTNSQPVLLTPTRQDVLPSPAERRQDKTACTGREIPKRKSLQRKMPITHLTKEAWELMESHVRRKRLQHAWGLPQVVQKSLLAFAPPPPEPQATKATMVACGTAEGVGGHGERSGAVELPKSWLETIVSPHLLTFLTAKVKDCLESHVRSWAVGHKWELPRLIRDSLRTLTPSRLKDKSTQKDSHVDLKEHHHKLYHHQHHECDIQLHCDRKEAPNKFAVWKKSKEKRKKTIYQGHQVTTSQACSKMVAFASPVAKVPFLSDDSWKTLQLHILHKRVQHDWGLPSMVMKSLNAFAPLPPDLENRTGKRIGKPYSSGHRELQTLPQNLSFLTSDTKEHLETHIRKMTTKHRWEMPKRIQQSLKRFQTPRHLFQSELEQAQPRLLPHNLVATNGSQTSQNMTRAEGYETVFRPEGKLTFLPVESRENLESHVQQKKIHHLWGLPDAVLKSLRAFAPCPLDEEKDTLCTGEIMIRRCQWEVHTTIGDLSFLDMSTKKHLEAHMRRRTAQHRWGLPKRVLQSVGVFLPPRPPPKLQLDQTQPLPPSQKKSFQESTFRLRSFLPLEIELPFLTGEERAHLEFHIQHKKTQHGWSLPSTVIKSLRAFAPLPSEVLKDTQGTRQGTKKPVGSTAEVQATTRRLSFLSQERQECLDAHVKHVVTQHKWGLPQRVQRSMKAFLPPQFEDSGSHLRALIQPQLESSLKKFDTRRREALEEKKTLATTPSARSTTTRAHVVKSEDLPFLAEEDRHLLEFHIQHKKIEHEWGLPGAVQRSLRAFAPLLLSSGPGGATERLQEKRAGPKKQWRVKEVDIAVQPLPFLSPSTKERLESHVKNLTVAHRWHLPKLVQESMRGFLPQVDEEERHLVYTDQAREISDASTKTETESISGSEDPRSYHSELFHEVIRDREMSSWLVNEEPTFCHVTKSLHSQRIQGRSWKDEREIGQGHSTRDKKRALDFHPKKTMPRLKSMVPVGAEPCTPSPSLSSQGMRRYSYNTSHWSEMPKGSQKRYPSARGSLRSKGRKPHPCSSKGSFKKKKTHWQLESTFKTRATDSHPPHRQKEPQPPGDSDMAWESVGSCQVSRCPCACHLSCSRSGSTSSVDSEAEQRRGKEEAITKANEPKGSSSYFFSKENEKSLLSSAKQGEERSSSLPSEDNGPHSSGSTTEVMDGFLSLPPEHNQPHNTGSANVMESSSLPLEHNEFHTSSAATQEAQKGYSSLLSKDSESENSSSSSEKGQTDQETSQPLEEDVVPRYNIPVYQDAWDTSMQSPHVVESNSSYEDIVARHYCQRHKGHKTKLSSKLQRKGSMPVWKTKSCHNLAAKASESHIGLQAPSRAEPLKVWPPEPLTDKGHSLESPPFVRVTEIPDKSEDTKASEDTAREDPQDHQLIHPPSPSRSQKRDETDPIERVAIVSTISSAAKISGRKEEGTAVKKAATTKPKGGNKSVATKEKKSFQPQDVKDAMPDERMAIICGTLEKKPHLQGGLKIGKESKGGLRDGLKQKHTDFLEEMEVSSTVKETKILAPGKMRNVSAKAPTLKPRCSKPECEYDRKVDEVVAILSSIVERKLDLVAGNEAWTKTKQRISNYSLKETHATPMKGAEVLKGKATAPGKTYTTEPGSGDHVLATKRKGKIRSGTTEKASKALCAGEEPLPKRELSPVFGRSREGEETRVGGPQPKKKDTQDHEKKSTFGRIFNTKASNWLKMRIWTRRTTAGPPAEGEKGGARVS